MPKSFQLGARTALALVLRRLGIVFTVWTYTLLAPLGWMFFAVLCWWWRRDPVQRVRRLQRVQVAAYRFMHDWLRLCRITRFDHRQGLPGLPEGPCVVVANHPTLMDITSVTALVGGGCTIVKPALFRRRLLHGLLVGAGHIEGPGADPISAGRVVDSMVGRLRQGMRAIIFPEGTRSPPGELGRFGRIAFEIACRANVPLVSLTIVCEPMFLSKQVKWYQPPPSTPVLRLALLAIDHPESSENCSRALRERVVARYREWSGKLAPAAAVAYDPPAEAPECQISSKTG